MWKILAQGELDRFDPIFAQLCADAGKEQRLHLLKLKSQRGLSHAQDEVTIFHRDGLGVAGDKFSREFFPSGADFVFVEAVLSPCGTENGGDEIRRLVNTGVEIGRFIRTSPLS